MASRESRINRAHAHARAIRSSMGSELRAARVASGLSQTGAGTGVGMSHAQLGRIERGELRYLTVEQLSRACVAVGLELVVRAFPDGDPVRDAGQLALLHRFRARLPAEATWRTEVPLPIVGDRRAWDAVATLRGTFMAVEAETRLRDIQALERRLSLKVRDGGIDQVLVVVADTRSNRQAIAAHREALRSLLPLDGRDVMRALRSGRLPDESGLLLA